LVSSFPEFMLNFLHAPTQNSKDLEKSISSCDLYARNAIVRTQDLSSYITAVCFL